MKMFTFHLSRHDETGVGRLGIEYGRVLDGGGDGE